MARVALIVGRVIFSFFFIYSGFNHLTKLSMYAQYAGGSGVPAPKLAVAVSGLMLLAGGLTVLLGVGVRWGALLLVIFLVATAVMMHRFWGVADPMMAANQAAHFWKNITLAGASLIIYALAALYPNWPYSVRRYGVGATTGA